MRVHPHPRLDIPCLCGYVPCLCNTFFPAWRAPSATLAVQGHRERIGPHPSGVIAPGNGNEQVPFRSGLRGQRNSEPEQHLTRDSGGPSSTHTRAARFVARSAPAR
jgi:hypothetical protein